MPLTSCVRDQRLASRLLCPPCGKCLMTQTLAACCWSTLRMHSTALVALPHSGTVGCFGHDAPGTCSLNSYRGYPVVILRGADRSTHVILSREGTTQGCPLAMYAACHAFRHQTEGPLPSSAKLVCRRFVLWRPTPASV